MTEKLKIGMLVGLKEDDEFPEFDRNRFYIIDICKNKGQRSRVRKYLYS